MRPIVARLVGSLVLLIVLGSQCDSAQEPYGPAKPIDKYMRALVNASHFSGTILVSRKGRVLKAAGYGLANSEWNIPNGLNTKFRIGSLTKQFTAMAIMMLQERGKLRISESICDFLMPCPSAWKPITIQLLLGHRSGIPDYLMFPDFEATQAQAVTPEQLIERFLYKPLDFSPGQRFEYSNSGYVVLGAIIERASGQTYEDFLQQNIFRKLNMADTGIDHAALVLPQRAGGYSEKKGTLANADYIDPSVAYSAGAMYSTALDLLQWNRALASNMLVSAATLKEIFAADSNGIGYGWVIGSLFGRPMIHHNGSINGFTANIARFPQDGVLVVVLANRDNVTVDAVTKDLAAIVFKQPYRMPTARKIVPLAPKDFDGLIGSYQITPDLKLTISRHEEHFYAELSGGKGRFEIFATSPANFFSTDPPVELMFKRTSDGLGSEVSINGEYVGKRIVP